MLIQEPKALAVDPILAVVGFVGGRGLGKELRAGVYQVVHFGSSRFLSSYEHYPNTTVGPFGICDDVEQLLKACPELEASDREFVVTVTVIRKADEPAEGGWRWCKWAEYIGVQKPQCEYIHDEPKIEEVLCFHIYEKPRMR